MASAATATAKAPSARWRAYTRLSLLVGWFAVCIVPHYLTKIVAPSRWAAVRAAAATGQPQGAPPLPPDLARALPWLWKRMWGNDVVL